MGLFCQSGANPSKTPLRLDQSQLGIRPMMVAPCTKARTGPGRNSMVLRRHRNWWNRAAFLHSIQRPWPVHLKPLVCPENGNDCKRGSKEWPECAPSTSFR